MKSDLKIREVLVVLLFCLFLAAMALSFLFVPKKDFSENEKRYLADAPALNLKNIVEGEFGTEAENWCADHLPARDFFVGLSASADRWMNLQVTKDIYITGSGRLLERPYPFSAETIRRNLSAINDFAEQTGKTVDLMLVPSAGYFLNEEIRGLKDEYEDEKIMEAVRELASPGVCMKDLFPAFSGFSDPGALYYQTDHHWTSLGAYTAASEYLRSKNRPVLPASAFEVTTEKGFHGTTYSRACFWDFPSEELELWDSGGAFEVRFSDRESVFGSLFFPEHLQEPDKYPVYLDGNHPLVTIENKSEDAEGSILVVRDSYANCMGCFLADSYKTVTMVDLRYYKMPLADLCAENDFDDILVLYSVGNFMTDSNIIWIG